MQDKLKKSDEEWKKELTPEQFKVMRCSSTEYPFSGKYTNTKTEGTYVCAACANPLFSSNSKYDSGSGWPSYFAPVSEDAIGIKEDNTMFMRRTEIHCAKCESHLGHLFEDGPKPTGLRYCVNSVSMDLIEDK